MFTGAILNCAPFLGLKSDSFLFVMATTAFSSEGNRGTQVRGAEHPKSLCLPWSLKRILFSLSVQCLSASDNSLWNLGYKFCWNAGIAPIDPQIWREEHNVDVISNVDVICCVPCSSHKESGKAPYLMAHGIAVPTDVFFHVFLTGHAAQTDLVNRIFRIFYNGT